MSQEVGKWLGLMGYNQLLLNFLGHRSSSKKKALAPHVFVDVLNDRLSRNVFDPAHPGTRVYGRGDAYLRWEDQEWMTKPRV